MKINKLFAITFFGLLFIFSSCSRQKSFTTVNEPSASLLSPFNTDQLITIPELAVSEYLKEPATFYTPSIEITDTFIGAESTWYELKQKNFLKRETNYWLI